MTARMMFLTGVAMSLAACSPRPEKRETTPPPPSAVDTSMSRPDTMTTRPDTMRRDTSKMAPSSTPTR